MIVVLYSSGSSLVVWEKKRSHPQDAAGRRGTKKNDRRETRPESQIKHRIFEIACGTPMPQLLSLCKNGSLLFLLVRRIARSSRATIRDALQEPVQVRTSTFTRKISVVGRGGERDGFGRTSKHIRDSVGKALELIRLEPDFVVDDIIMCRTDCALKTVVCLKEEIEICADCPLVSHQ